MCLCRVCPDRYVVYARIVMSCLPGSLCRVCPDVMLCLSQCYVVSARIVMSCLPGCYVVSVPMLCRVCPDRYVVSARMLCRVRPDVMLCLPGCYVVSVRMLCLVCPDVMLCLPGCYVVSVRMLSNFCYSVWIWNFVIKLCFSKWHVQLNFVILFLFKYKILQGGTASNILILIHLLTAIGLAPGGSSTVHIYTRAVHRTAQWNRIQHINNNKNT